MRVPAVAVGSLLSIAVLFAPACPPAPDQEVGWVRDHGVNARAELLRLLLVAGLPATTALIGRALARRRVAVAAEPESERLVPSSAGSREWIRRGVIPCLALAGLSFLLFSRIPPNLDLFESGHALLPLQTYLDGGLPYRDVIPAHGLGADGGLSCVAHRAVGDSLAAIARFENRLLCGLFWPSVFMLGFAATCRIGWGLLSTALLYLYLPQAGFLRPVPALLALAAGLWTARRSTAPPWIAVGALAGLAALYSVDFGAYAALATAVCLVVSRGSRPRNLVFWALGLVAILLICGLLVWGTGILGTFLEVHVAYLPKLYAIYAFGLRSVVSQAADGDATALLFVLCLMAGAAIVGRAVGRPATPAEQPSPLLPLAAFFLAASLSVVDRHHYAYAFLVVPAGVCAALASRVRSPRARAAAIAGLLAAVAVTTSVGAALGATFSRLRPFVLPPGWVRLEAPARTRDVYVRQEDATLIDATGQFVTSALADGETWLDLANAPALYYVFDRRPAVRFYGVPLMQPAMAQAEVVSALRGDAGIAAVLVRSGPRAADCIDGIENRRRVPEVWKVVESCFEPAFEDGDIEFWIRKATGCASPRRLD